jgi:uncharacterized membrane protein YeaQ/YmgE (transglycosylase-associated protein family)
MDIGKLIVWLIVGALAGNLAGMLVTLRREGLGRWVNLVVGIAGAVVGGYLFQLFRIDLGLGDLKVTFEDLLAAFLGSLLLICAAWVYRLIRHRGRPKP